MKSLAVLLPKITILFLTSTAIPKQRWNVRLSLRFHRLPLRELPQQNKYTATSLIFTGLQFLATLTLISSADCAFLLYNKSIMKICKLVIFTLSCTIATQALPAWQVKTAALQALQHKISKAQALCFSAGMLGISYAAHKYINHAMFSRSKKMKIYADWVNRYEHYKGTVDHYLDIATKLRLSRPMRYVRAPRDYFRAEKWLLKHTKWVNRYETKKLNEKLEEYSNYAFTVGAASTTVPLSIIFPTLKHVILPWALQQSMGIRISIACATGAIALTPPVASILYFALGINDPQISKISEIFIIQCGIGAVAGEFAAGTALLLGEIFNLKLNRF